jgi:F0F1-type ATP synthase epsilon subunit
MSAKNDLKQLKVIARAPFHIYYEGPAKVVSAANRVGEFDVLPGHADFFSVMVACKIIIETDSDNISFSITGGIIGVRNDEVSIFVNI